MRAPIPKEPSPLALAIRANRERCIRESFLTGDPHLDSLLTGIRDFCPARWSHDMTTPEMRDAIDFSLLGLASGAAR